MGIFKKGVGIFKKGVGIFNEGLDIAAVRPWIEAEGKRWLARLVTVPRPARRKQQPYRATASGDAQLVLRPAAYWPKAGVGIELKITVQVSCLATG